MGDRLFLSYYWLSLLKIKMALRMVSTFSVYLKDLPTPFEALGLPQSHISKCSCAFLSLKGDMGGEAKFIFTVTLVPNFELRAPDTGLG